MIGAFPQWSFEYVWYELPFDLAIGLYENTWRERRKQQEGTWLTAYYVASFMLAFSGNKMPEFENFLPDYLKPPKKKIKVNARYSKRVVNDVELAFKLGVLSQNDLALLGYKDLKDSGAWND